MLQSFLGDRVQFRAQFAVGLKRTNLAVRGPVDRKRSVLPVSSVAAVGQAPSNSESIRSGPPPCTGTSTGLAVDNATVRLARSHVHTGFTERYRGPVDPWDPWTVGDRGPGGPVWDRNRRGPGPWTRGPCELPRTASSRTPRPSFRTSRGRTLVVGACPFSTTPGDSCMCSAVDGDRHSACVQ